MRIRRRARGQSTLRPRRAARGVGLVVVVTLSGAASTPVVAQDLTDPARLRGTTPVAVRASVEWDEQITNTAGGATEAQYHEAVLQTFRDALQETEVPIDEAAEAVVLCRVETFYDQGLIAYAVRVELLRPLAPEGTPAVVWQRSWVGTTAVGGLHRMFSLGEQCAEDFASDWVSANGV